MSSPLLFHAFAVPGCLARSLRDRSRVVRLRALFLATAALGCSLDSRDVQLPEPDAGSPSGDTTTSPLKPLSDAASGESPEPDMQGGSDAGAEAQCEPLERGCSAQGAPQICDPSGVWQAEAPCDPINPICVDGQCKPCRPRERRCNGEGVPEVCAADGSSWSAEAACSAPLVCVPETGSCGECSPGSARACVEELGNCASGQQLCGADASWGPCSIAPALADSCEPGDDATCDGSPNGNCACTADVSCGPAADVGICRRGVSACSQGALGACQGAITPAARDCASSLDNDCDGFPDNRLDATCQCEPEAVEACDQHPGLDSIGICRAGTRRCIASAGRLASQWGSCQGAVAPRPRDCRSNLDNNCDGLVDNALDGVCQCVPGSQRACGAAPDSFGCALGTETCELRNGGAESRWGQCSFAPVANDTDCDDRDLLTLDDSCQAGRCVGRPWGRVAIGNDGVCAIRSGGVVYCWRGVGLNATRGTAPVRVGLPTAARSVGVGARQACAVLDNGQLWCWGSNDAGQLGTGDLTSAPLSEPRRVTGVPTARMVVPGGEGTLALDSSGAPLLWGGVPSTLYLSTQPGFRSLVPLPIAGVSGAALLTLGARHACALLATGEVYCWGQNEFLQLGSGEQVAQPSARLVPNLDDAVFIDAGNTATCAVRENGEVTCWGNLGCGSPAASCVARVTVPNMNDARQVSISNNTACALRASGAVACWGIVASPAGGTQTVVVPVAIGVSDAVQIAATDEVDGGHCALRANGQVVCWSANDGVGAVTGLPN